MKDRPNFNELSKQIYKANKAKGFHDEEQSNETLFMLVITELAEAVEADRKGKRADYKKYQRYIDDSKKSFTDMNIAFEFCYKNTLEDELADAVIRLFDLAGLRGDNEFLTYPEKDMEELFDLATRNNSDKTFSEIIYAVSSTIFTNKPTFVKIKQALISIEWLCYHLSIDLWYHVELKLKYNETRDYKHGKLY